jgi:hypothetical protein
LSDSVISAGWNFNEMPVELGSDDSSNDDEFALNLDSDRDAEGFNLTQEEQ